MATIDVSPPIQGPTPPRSTGRPHHVVMVVFGVLLLGLGLILAGVAAPLGAALTQQRDGGFLSSPTERYEVASYAITSQRLDVVLDDGVAWSGQRSGVGHDHAPCCGSDSRCRRLRRHRPQDRGGRVPVRRLRIRSWPSFISTRSGLTMTRSVATGHRRCRRSRTSGRFRPTAPERSRSRWTCVPVTGLW